MNAEVGLELLSALIAAAAAIGVAVTSSRLERWNGPGTIGFEVFDAQYMQRFHRWFEPIFIRDVQAWTESAEARVRLINAALGTLITHLDDDLRAPQTS